MATVPALRYALGFIDVVLVNTSALDSSPSEFQYIENRQAIQLARVPVPRKQGATYTSFFEVSGGLPHYRLPGR